MKLLIRLDYSAGLLAVTPAPPPPPPGGTPVITLVYLKCVPRGGQYMGVRTSGRVGPGVRDYSGGGGGGEVALTL